MRFAAERRNLANAISELRELAGGRDDILAEAGCHGGFLVRLAIHPSGL